MGFLKSLFSPSANGQTKGFYSISVQCDLCKEVIESRINLSNDLTPEYENEGEVYYIRKVLIGNKSCFQRIEVELKFDASKQLLEKHAGGGQFV